MKDDSVVELEKELERLKKALDHERQKNRLLLQSMVDGVYTTDLEKRITFWNDAAARITGYTPEMAVGNSCKLLLCHTDESGACLCDDSCPLTGAMEKDIAMVGKEVYSRTLSGMTLPVSVSCSPLRDEYGNMVGAIEVFRDISEQKMVEEQKKNFFQMVTHDLKSPLTAIMGYAELLLDDTTPENFDRQREYLEIIKTSSSNMSEMISDFLDLTMLDSYTASPDRSEIDLVELIEDLAAEHAPSARARDITLTLDMQAGMPQAILDRHMVKRAVSNLITNAIKYTPQGGTVVVAAACDGNTVTISVVDNGYGIPEDERESIFDMYYRCKATGHIPGTGLGLPLVAAVAKTHGGTVRVEEGDNSGSRFTLTFPASVSGNRNSPAGP